MILLPKVSVITITYNLVENGRTDYIHQCIESVHQQNYANLEHIVIDGNSKDGTLEILQDYVQKGWIKLWSEADTGIPNAYNKGLAKSSGKYIAFLNSDDFYIDDEAVAESVKALEKTGAMYSFAPFYVSDFQGNILKKVKPAVLEKFIRQTIGHPSMFFRDEYFKIIGNYCEDYKIAADFDLILRAELKGLKGVEVSKAFAVFRNTGVSTKEEQKVFEESKTVLIKNYRQFGADEKVIDKILERRYLPLRLMRKILKHCHAEDAGKIWWYNFKKFCKYIRHQLFTIRTRKGRRCLKLLGMTLIKEKKNHG